MVVQRTLPINVIGVTAVAEHETQFMNIYLYDHIWAC